MLITQVYLSGVRGGQCYVINPIYNIGFVGCDKYGNLDGSKLIGYNPNQNANRSGYYTK